MKGFCEAELAKDHTTTGVAICDLFLTSVRYIRDAEEVSQVTRSIASGLAAAKRASIKRIWQRCYDDLMAEQSETRLTRYQLAVRNFEEAATLRPKLNRQLEGEPSDNTVPSEATESDKTPFITLALSNESGSEYSPTDDNTLSTLGPYEEPPTRLNWLVGPGDVSSRLTTNTPWKIDGTDISQTLADRRTAIMRALELITDPDILAARNFIYTRKILQDIMSVNDWTKCTQSWQSEYDCQLDLKQLEGVCSFACNMDAATTLNQAIVRARSLDSTNPMHSIIDNHLRTTVLWSMESEVPGQLRQVNEDTFINDYIKPIMDGLFGDLDDCVMHWTRDELQCGPCYRNEEKMYPDFFLAMKNHAVAIMEAKTPNKGAAAYKDDRRKLLDQMKLSIDGLLSSGVNTSVVGFQISGPRVEVMAMSLKYEACYLVVDIGQFDLVTSRFQFGNLLTAARPLLAARRIVLLALETLRRVKGSSAAPIHTELRRGTYHTTPVAV
ncbi:hypothetical protein DFQ27_009879 [Actinomortierella ambigua]|uniref:Uncharacterized protein n=1 Tax=Actinomortierella ambigua TaxID=1343610 RepID=A0A9P6PP04_9FUNG|nr:hypothetical protein DFQ27_009879 [Actinomortierella ambigua]